MDLNNSGQASRPSAFLTPLGAWALSLGCAVGWGAFMMPGNTFLPAAGPLGTVIGIAAGALIMLIVGVNYHCMINACPSAGGTFSYVVKCFDYDHGFVAAWFLLLTYIAVIWANATALPLIGRFLLGDVFQFGAHYRIAGFDIYLGELALSVTALVCFCMLCLHRRAAVVFQTVMAVLLCAGVLACAVAVFRHTGSPAAIRPAFAPGKKPVLAVFTIIAMGPWAFVGFESISHSAGEFSFPTKKALPIMAAALLAGAAIYALLAVIAASTLPDGFSDWPAYIAALDTLDRSQAAPTFYAVRSAMGPVGTPVLVVTVLGGVLTGLVGNTIAASRLICVLGREGLLPRQLGALDRGGAPRNAIFLILGVSVIIPLFGRTAVGWIVDVTTVGAAIVYAYTSACALKQARQTKNTAITATGLAGVVISLVFLLYYLVPNLLSVSAMGRESYLILSLWSLLGLIVFRFLLNGETERRLGHSTIVWIVTLSLVFFTSLVWMRETSNLTAGESIDRVSEYYAQELADHDAGRSREELTEDAAFLERQKSELDSALTRNSFIQIGFMVLSMLALFNIYGIIHRREKETEREKLMAEESSRAKTSFLSNMSHEIRTPMNAIIGLDNIALKDPDLPPRTREHLEKIGASANHLLGLINDILDMSRIESGRMTLKEEAFSFRDFLDQINVIVNGQCRDKGLDYDCVIVGKVGGRYIGDALKLKQVLINILGNAVKFTKQPGSITLTVEQTASFEDYSTLRFIVRDTGIGMSRDFIPKIFDSFSQENTGFTDKYGSTGLGMAITKNLVQMMNGDIQVDSEKGVGSTFTVTVTLRAAGNDAEQDPLGSLPPELRVIVVDDDEIALEHARLVLAELGLSADLDASPSDALARIRERFEKGIPYGLILTDQRMPEMDGLSLVRAVREFDGGRTPVILLTGYNLDEAHELAAEYGIDRVLSKPLFADSLKREIHALLSRGGRPADASGEEAGDAGGSLAGLHVLAAEDIDLNAEILAGLLEMEGVVTDRAENGQAAVELFSSHPENYYGAILMDVRMPVMDGLAATAAIRALPREDARRVPIIAMTANAFDDDVQRSLQAGMNAHLSKPVEPDRLFETLRRLALRDGE